MKNEDRMEAVDKQINSRSGVEMELDQQNGEMSEGLREALQEGIAELDRGEGIPHDVVMAEFAALLRSWE